MKVKGNCFQLVMSTYKFHMRLVSTVGALIRIALLLN